MKTKILPKNKALKEAVRVLKRGGLIVYPTETAYGLGADATQNASVRKIFSVKKRKYAKKISIAFSSHRMAEKHLDLTEDARKLMKKFMPGPLTLVVHGTGFRIPDNAFARKMISAFGKPVTATSANLAGAPHPYRIKDVMEMKGKADLIINAGNLSKQRVSTVFDVDKKKILRRGPIRKREVMNAL